MPRYTAYGLTIESDIALPELIVSFASPDTVPDAIISLGSIDQTGLIPPPPGESTGRADARETVLLFEPAGAYRIRCGNEIVIDRKATATDSAIRLYLLGPVLAVLLHQRGLIVLHASAILIGGEAVAFVAEKGTGKSTLAAAFHARGHGIVADDLVPVDVDTSTGPMVHPGFPQLKLFPEAAAQLGDCGTDLPKLLDDYDKRARRSDRDFPQHQLPIRRVYVLCNGEDERIESMPGQAAFKQLVRHSFVLPLLQATNTQGIHFRQAVQLATLLKVQTLQRRRSLSLLPEVVRMVEADCEAA
jgi:hypothetical protein